LVSLMWHPGPGNPFHFGFKMPHPLLWLGIILVGLGAGLVLYAKEASEVSPPAKVEPAPRPPQPAPEVQP
jgi:hypothetical protein